MTNYSIKNIKFFVQLIVLVFSFGFLYKFSTLQACTMNAAGYCDTSLGTTGLFVPRFNLNNINNIMPSGSIDITGNINNGNEFNFTVQYNGSISNNDGTLPSPCVNFTIPDNSVVDNAIIAGHPLKFLYQIYYWCRNHDQDDSWKNGNNGNEQLFTNIASNNSTGGGYCVDAYMQYAVYDQTAESFLLINNNNQVNTVSIYHGSHSYLLGGISSIEFSSLNSSGVNSSSHLNINPSIPSTAPTSFVSPGGSIIASAVSIYPQQVIEINVPAPKVPTITSVKSSTAPVLVSDQNASIQPNEPNVGSVNINQNSFDITFNFKINYGNNSYNVSIPNTESITNAITSGEQLILVYQIYYNCQLSNFSGNIGAHFNNIILPKSTDVLSSYGYLVDGFLQYYIYNPSIQDSMPINISGSIVNSVPIFSNVADFNLGSISSIIFSSNSLNSNSAPITISSANFSNPSPNLLNKEIYFNTDMINYATSFYPAQAINLNPSGS